MKDSFYFPHDTNAANDQRVLKLRAKFNNAFGYGVYFMILEAMAQEDSGVLDTECMAQLSLSYGLAIEQLRAVLECCIEVGLFVQDETGIYSKRMLEHKMFRKERSESGRKGATSRWKNGSATEEPMAIKEKEIKGNKIKEKEIGNKNNLQTPSAESQQVLEWYNALFKKSFTSTYGFEKNLHTWLSRPGNLLIHVKEALEVAVKDAFWKDKMDPVILFRTKDPRGQDVDRISQLLSKVRKTAPTIAQMARKQQEEEEQWLPPSRT